MRNVLWESADIDDLISKKGTARLFIRWCPKFMVRLQ